MGTNPINPPPLIPQNKPEVPSGAKSWEVSNIFSVGWQGKSGDFDIELKINPQVDSDIWAPGGLIFAADRNFNENSEFVVLAVSTSYGIVFNSIGQNLFPQNQIKFLKPERLPIFIKLNRTGKIISAYYKNSMTDKWKKIGEVQISSGSLIDPDVGEMLFENNNLKEKNILSGGFNGE